VVATSILDPTKTAAATVTVNSSDNGGCSTTSGSLAGLLPLLALVAWTLSRRRRSTAR